MTIALFDFDGTITTHETMSAFVKQSTTTRRLLIGYLYLWPMLIGYKYGLVSGQKFRAAVVRAAYKGMVKADVEAAGRAFAVEYLENCIRPEAMERIAWHRAQGHDVAIVSGALDCYLRPWAEKYNLEVICSTLEAHNGKLTGLYRGRQCVRAEKARAVRRRFGTLKGRRVYAYGDTAEDRQLLGIATDPFYREMPQSVG